MNQRHAEFFGPDLGRGPFASSRLDAAAVQIATALAQLRAPLSRADDDILGHADFIRQLADRIAPDYASYISIDVGDESANQIRVTLRTAIASFSLFDIWLSDTYGGGLTQTSPGSVSFGIGTVLETITPNKRYMVVTSGTGIIDVSVTYTGEHTWYIGIARAGRVFYSPRLDFFAV